jgi:DNA-binding transcriptional LysR family regulator
MNLNLIQCFLVLARTLSFTESARLLSLTQPSVSRQIQALESELKVRLFIRDKHRVQLSAAGKKYRAQVAPLYDQLERISLSSQEKADRLSGPIHFGCLSEIGQSLFGELAIKFQKLNPEVELRIDYQLDHQIVEQIKAGEKDFGIVSKPPIQESLRIYRLIQERSILVTRAKNPNQKDLRREDIPTAKFVAYSRWDGLLTEFLNTYYRGLTLGDINHLSTANAHRTMLQMLQIADAYAFMPYFSAQAAVEKGELRIASSNELSRTLYWVELESPIVSAKNRMLRKFLTEECRKKG